MRSRTILLNVALCFIGLTVCYAQNPFMGTWKLNEAKSKLSPSTAQNTKVVYESAGLEETKVSIDGTDSTGNSTHNEWTGKIDGKDYPVTGDPNSDSRSLKRTGIPKLDFKVKKGAKITTTGRIIVSEDGKSRTVISSGVDSQGKRFKSTAVYDKE